MRGAPKSKGQKAADARARRDARRAEGKCYQCGAEIGWRRHGSKSGLCQRCLILRDQARARHDAAHPGRERSSLVRSPVSAARRATKLRELRMEDKLGGVCTQPGCHEASLDDSLFCRTHRDAHRIWSRDYHRRKSWHRILAMNIWMAAIEPLRSEKTGKLPVRYRNPLRSVTKSVTRYDDSVTHVTAA